MACSFYQAIASGLIIAFMINMVNKGNLIKEIELMAFLHDRERKQMELSREYSELIGIKAHDLKRILTQPEQPLSAEDRKELHVENTFSGELRYKTADCIPQRQTPPTTVSVRSMEWIVNCHGGTIKLSHKNGIFPQIFYCRIQSHEEVTGYSRQGPAHPQRIGVSICNTM